MKSESHFVTPAPASAPVVGRLIDEERLKAEEAQRKVILNLNASGAVARLTLQAQERRYRGGSNLECIELF